MAENLVDLLELLTVVMTVASMVVTMAAWLVESSVVRMVAYSVVNLVCWRAVPKVERKVASMEHPWVA